jgi:hypothetical protein
VTGCSARSVSIVAVYSMNTVSGLGRWFMSMYVIAHWSAAFVG